MSKYPTGYLSFTTESNLYEIAHNLPYLSFTYKCQTFLKMFIMNKHASFLAQHSLYTLSVFNNEES
jgi:hypothetical protein